MGTATLLFRVPWVALGPRVVEGVPEPVSVQVLRTCSLGSEPDETLCVIRRSGLNLSLTGRRDLP